jgi:uncharacterized protein YciI
MKTTITVGLIADKHVVLKDPSIDVDAHIDFLRKLTIEKGLITSGKSKQQVQEAVVLHSTKGAIKRRKF